MLMKAQSATASNCEVGQAVKVAIVVCTHNRPFALERCLRSIAQLDCSALSVIVVDSAPNTREAQEITSRYGADYVISTLKGLSRARNIGSRATDAEIIAYLDDDMVPHPRWLSSLLAEFRDDSVTV